MKKFKIITITIITICILLYEIAFCNLYNIMQNQYSFSIFRILMYLIFVIIFKKFSYKFFEDAEPLIKKKKNLIITYIVAIVIYTIYIIIRKEQLWTILFSVLVELLGLVFILFITKDYIKNIIISTITLGTMFALCNDVFHVMDEKQHFNSALNLAYFNLDYKTEEIGSKEYQEIERNTPMKKFVQEYGYKKHNIKLEEVEYDALSSPTEYSTILYVPCAIGINIARLLGR